MNEIKEELLTIHKLATKSFDQAAMKRIPMTSTGDNEIQWNIIREQLGNLCPAFTFLDRFLEFCSTKVKA